MKKCEAFGLMTAFLAGAAASVAATRTAYKIAKEVRRDIVERDFASPNGEHTVTLSIGSAQTVKGLSCVSVKAASVGKEEDCRLLILAKKQPAFLSGTWSDNDHFRLLVGTGRRKQCCDICFEGGEITANYYLAKEN